MPRKKLDIKCERVIKDIKNKGFTLLSISINGAKSILNVKCDICGYIWYSTIKNLQGQKKCFKCAKKAMPTIDEIRAFVESKNGTLLSKDCETSKTKIHIRCNICLYEWFPDWNHIQQKRWCKKCSKKIAPTLIERKTIVDNMGFILLSDYYKNNKTKQHLKCKKCGHEWHPSWDSIQQGHGCPKCADILPYSLEEMRDIIKNKGGTLLSDIYINAHTKLHIRCNLCDYEWFPIWHNIDNNKWCPKCSLRKNQRLLTDVLKELLKEEPFCDYTGFDWLKTKSGKKQELDIYFPKSKLAVEYDGEQHFRPVDFFGGDKHFKETKRLDRLKNRKIKQHPKDVKYFIRFSYKENITKEYVMDKLKKIGIKINKREED